MKSKNKNRRTPPTGARPSAPASAGGISATLSSALRASLCALCTLLVLSVCAAAVAYAAPDPDARTMPLSLCVLALSCLFGGWTAFRRGRRTGSTVPILCALLCGILLIVLLFGLSLCLPDGLRGQWPPSIAWGLRGGMLVFCLLGAVMASYAPRKRRKRRK